MDERAAMTRPGGSEETHSLATADTTRPPTSETNAQTHSLSTTDRAPEASDRVETDVLVGQMIGDYQVRRLLGSGGMGRVYLARDIKLGRSIALKIVRGSTHAGFLGEARAIARLNHPNIVQLYECDEYGSGLYLALEYVKGESLHERARRPMGVDEILRHVRSIADALAHAHEAGVFHCDLKPSNVMIGNDGRLRVVDFGLAHVDTGSGAGGGTPGWMAPEQHAGDPLTDRVDSWALGIMTAQLLTGDHPLGDDPKHATCDPDRVAVFHCERRDVPAAVVGLVARSLERTPALRPTAAEWKRVLDGAIEGRTDALAEDGPYPGLAAFYEQNARFYFGREVEIEEFLECLRRTPCLPIVGPSGIGKSSFLHAGVIPRLKARERWVVISLRPGAQPVAALARRVLAASATEGLGEPELAAAVEEYAAELRETPTLLAARLATLAAALEARILLVVDQLEEAFTHGAPETECARFLEMLLHAADDPLDPVRVVFTIRDDFIGKIPGARSLFVIEKLGKANLRRTIEGPLARCGYQFDDPAIIDELLGEVGNIEVADLPLLQFACRTLWDGRDPATRELRRATYQEMGGLAGALARHAERALQALSEAERRTARELLLQLVSGTTRRTVARDRLVTAAGPNAEWVLDRLVSARLLAQRTAADGEGSIVEIAHESLLQTWSQLARWVDESRDERRLLDELDGAASRWESRGKRTDETWPQRDLAGARFRAAQLDLALPPRVEAFLAAGEERHRRDRRSRRLRYGIALAAVGVAAVFGFFLIGRYVSRERLIRMNAGTVELGLSLYDWIDGAPRPVPASQAPRLAWKLYTAKPGEPHRPAEPMPPELVEAEDLSRDGSQRIILITAPGGTMFLEVTGRGARGETCPASWIRIASFPGWGGDRPNERLAIEIPTCQASSADMAEVDAGDFIYGGPGRPPSKKYGELDYTLPEQTLFLPAFSMDRTEVSNARFDAFKRLERITGYPAPIYPTDDAIHADNAKPSSPVAYVDAFQAEAFCRYHGKQLPTDRQWMKAVRGGLSLGGASNPAPARTYPWGPELRPECVNDDRPKDGYPWVAPVDSFACGASPYGILHLVGNVQEWMAREDQPIPTTPLRTIRGGGMDSPPQLEHTTTLFINQRGPRDFNYSVGFRCVSNP